MENQDFGILKFEIIIKLVSFASNGKKPPQAVPPRGDEEYMEFRLVLRRVGVRNYCVYYRIHITDIVKILQSLLAIPTLGFAKIPYCAE